MERIHERFDLVKHPNVLTLDLKKISEGNSGSPRSLYFTLRQYVHQSLKQRLVQKVPAMHMSEKKWFTF
jgi:hypothetical protein